MWNKLSPYDFGDNLFHLIDKEWMLITAKNPETGKCNTMTASWGGCGILWNKPVAFLFIRPQRYTMEFVNANDTLTLSFFHEAYRDALRLCGSVSGRDCDKIAKAGLHSEELETENALGFQVAKYTFVCRKLYQDVLKESAFLDPSLLANYKAGDYHNVFICEIEEILEKA